MELFMAVPFSAKEIEIVKITCSRKNAEGIGNFLAEKFKDDPRFVEIPPVKEQLAKYDKEQEK